MSLRTALFRPLEYLYHTASAIKRWAYFEGPLPRAGLGVPVISVGNITAGGTGKTPVVAALTEALTPLFGRVGLLSRAYGAKYAWSLNLVSDGQRVLLDRPWSGDEPVAIRQAAGMTIAASGKNRARSGEYLARKLGVNLLILDDGFQYWRMRRDLDIVLVDATNPFGSMAFLPVGRLREHPSALARAGLVMVTRTGDPGALSFDAVTRAVRRFNPECPVIPCAFRPCRITPFGSAAGISLDSLRGRPVAAFCGIGNPGSFRSLLEGLGARVENFEVFPDHHPYSPAEVSRLVEGAASLNVDLYTTTKDLANLPLQIACRAEPPPDRRGADDPAPSLRGLEPTRVFAVETRAVFDTGEVLEALLRAGVMPGRDASMREDGNGMK